MRTFRLMITFLVFSFHGIPRFATFRDSNCLTILFIKVLRERSKLVRVWHQAIPPGVYDLSGHLHRYIYFPGIWKILRNAIHSIWTFSTKTDRTRWGVIRRNLAWKSRHCDKREKKRRNNFHIYSDPLTSEEKKRKKRKKRKKKKFLGSPS